MQALTVNILKDEVTGRFVKGDGSGGPGRPPGRSPLATRRLANEMAGKIILDLLGQSHTVLQRCLASDDDKVAIRAAQFIIGKAHADDVTNEMLQQVHLMSKAAAAMRRGDMPQAQQFLQHLKV